MWKSTEHNIDLFVAFQRLYQITGDDAWQERADHAKAFVLSLWDESTGHFLTGTGTDGVTPNEDVSPLDVNPWALLALRDSSYAPGITWAENNCFVQADPFVGFDFDTDLDGIWWEGTGQMVAAYHYLGDTSQETAFLSALEKAQREDPMGDGKGIVASNINGLTTGFDWAYFNRLAVAPTAWFLYAERGYNPYWSE